MTNYFFKSYGQYLGFIDGENIFSWNGLYLGWIENSYVWDTLGQFRGEVKKIDNHLYILKNVYALPPLPKMPKLNPLPVISTPAPQANIPPISLDIGWVDGF
jgi:hypothetical protein